VSVSILRALADKNLFQAHFAGPSWDRWRTFLAALYALPMTDEQQEIYRYHTGRTEPPTAPAREAALVIGRRGGKSRILALIAVYLACFRDHTKYLSAGETGTIAVLATDRRQARLIFRYAEALLREIPLLAPLLEAVRDDTLVLNNRAQIMVQTASFRVTRGYTFVAVLADETAFWRDENTQNPDVEIFRALRPGLGTVPNSLLINASSPYRKSGVLYSTYKRHYGKDGARVLVWKATTLEMNPSLDPAIVDEAFEDDPESASAEFGAEFRDDINDFISREIIEACIVPGRKEQVPVRGTRYVGFCDPSGGSADSMTLAVGHRDGNIAVLDAVREVKPPFSPELVVRDFASMLKAFKVPEVVGDRYAGEWPRERFREHGINYRVSDKPKSDLYRDVLPLLNSGKAELLDLPRLVAQFCGLERRTARGGRDSIDHSPGGHDDLCNSVAGVLLQCTAKQPIRISREAWARVMQPDVPVLW
jgi:hypothetical protein